MADLSGVNVGDYLAIDDRFSGVPRITSVSKVTATQVVAGDRRFAKTTGRTVGQSSGFRSCFARPATDKDVTAARVNAAQYRLSKFVVTADNVDAIEALLKDMTQ